MPRAVARVVLLLLLRIIAGLVSVEGYRVCFGPLLGCFRRFFQFGAEGVFTLIFHQPRDAVDEE